MAETPPGRVSCVAPSSLSAATLRGNMRSGRNASHRDRGHRFRVRNSLWHGAGSSALVSRSRAMPAGGRWKTPRNPPFSWKPSPPRWWRRDPVREGCRRGCLAKGRNPRRRARPPTGRAPVPVVPDARRELLHPRGPRDPGDQHVPHPGGVPVRIAESGRRLDRFRVEHRKRVAEDAEDRVAWISTRPGTTASPETSVRCPALAADRSAIATMRSALMPISATCGGFPRPSYTSPPTRIRS